MLHVGRPRVALVYPVVKQLWNGADLGVAVVLFVTADVNKGV
jgi:hypothetical protein